MSNLILGWDGVVGFVEDMKRPVHVYSGLKQLLPYPRGWAWQHVLRRSETDSLLLLEHHPVYTLGRGGKWEHLQLNTDATLNPLYYHTQQHENWTVDELAALGKPAHHSFRETPIYRVERGGQVTFHGPGQLVVYPVLNLRNYKKDLHWWMESLQQIVQLTLQSFGLNSRTDQIGVWVGDRKLCALGCAARGWTTTHGLALNVSTDLQYFDAIRPCGLNQGVTSLQEELGHDVAFDQVADTLMQHFAQVLHVELVEGHDLE